MFGCRDADIARRAFAHLGYLADPGVDLIERRADRGDQLFPASVGETERVVRVSSRTPILASNRRIMWLSADWETSSLAAAR
jgi:hypothetical protein